MLSSSMVRYLLEMSSLGSSMVYAQGSLPSVDAPLN